MKYPHYVYMVMIEWYWCEVKQLNIENNGIKLNTQLCKSTIILLLLFFTCGYYESKKILCLNNILQKSEII